jgi:hypothetical protein
MKSRMSFTFKKMGPAHKTALVLVVLSLPFLLGAWRISRGRAINPTYVERIQDGKTQKHEILTLFGDPDDIDRTPEAVVYIYKTYRDKEVLPKRERRIKSTVQDSPYFQEDWIKEKAEREAGETKELDRMLIIRFDPEEQTVKSHDFKQY